MTREFKIVIHASGDSKVVATLEVVSLKEAEEAAAMYTRWRKENHCWDLA